MTDLDEFIEIPVEDQIINWKTHHNEILIDWADKAACYKWLHVKSCLKYTSRRNMFTIPVIAMSTLTGTANFALEKIPIEYQQWAAIGIGSINLLAGIITTVSQFLKINELVESHRVAAIAWDKFYRSIRIELIKCPAERTDVAYVLKSSKDEFDRLMETSPSIQQNILTLFTKTLTNGKTNVETIRKKQIFESLRKPEIFNEIRSLREVVYKDDDMNNDILQNQLSIILDSKKSNNQKITRLKEFIKEFKIQYNRLPTTDEIMTNISGVTANNIQKVLNNDDIMPNTSPVKPN